MLSVGGMRTFFNKYGNGCALVLLLVFAVPLIVNFSSNQLGGRAARSSAGASAEDTVIATVNDQPITEAEFREMAARMQRSMGNAAPGRPYAEMQGRVVQRLIQLAVIRQEAQKRNARPLEADIDREIDKMKQQLAQQQGKDKTLRLGLGCLSDEQPGHVNIRPAGADRQRLDPDGVDEHAQSRTESLGNGRA